MATRLRYYLPAAHHHPATTRSRLFAWLRAAMDRTRQRHKLAELDDRLLRDIGITAAQARDESDKGFWQSARGEYAAASLFRELPTSRKYDAPHRKGRIGTDG